MQPRSKYQLGFLAGNEVEMQPTHIHVVGPGESRLLEQDNWVACIDPVIEFDESFSGLL